MSAWVDAAALPIVRTVEPWIDYKESSPVLVVVKNPGWPPRQLVATFRQGGDEYPDSTGWYSNCRDTYTLSNVTHWRPLDWPKGVSAT